MLNLVAIFLGGGLGALSRHTLGILFKYQILSIPLAIIIINIIGCFFIGIFNVLLGKIFPDIAYLRYFFITGFLGGFTTFSSFSLEAWSLFEKYNIYIFGLYVVISVIGSLGAFIIANILMKKLGF